MQKGDLASMMLKDNPNIDEFIMHVSALSKLALFNKLPEKNCEDFIDILSIFKAKLNIKPLIHTNQRLIMDISFILWVGRKYEVLSYNGIEISIKNGLNKIKNKELTIDKKLELNLLCFLFSLEINEKVDVNPLIPGFCNRNHFFTYFMFLYNKENIEKSSHDSVEIDYLLLTSFRQGFYYEAYCFLSLSSNEGLENKLTKYIITESPLNKKNVSVNDSLALLLWEGKNYEKN